MIHSNRHSVTIVALALGFWGCNDAGGDDPTTSSGGAGAGSSVGGSGGESSGGSGGDSTSGGTAGTGSAAGGAGGGGGSTGGSGGGSAGGAGGGGGSAGGSGGGSAGGSGGGSAAGGAGGGGGSAGGSGGCAAGEVQPCYSGPAGTEGVGICHGGMQTCIGGAGYGQCDGEQVPGTEVCDAGHLDEDCSGLSEDLPSGCSCGDGLVGPGEECDDGNADSTDDCTSQCKTPVCGDAFVQTGSSEECDDGNASDGDACTQLCVEQAVLQVNTGDTHVCALLNGGRVKCWGHKDRLGIGNIPDVSVGDGAGEMGASLPFVNVGNEAVPVTIAAGASHTCVLFDDGKVKCWGENGYGQLGLGNANDVGLNLNAMGNDLPFLDLGLDAIATAISAGGHHTCALLDDGSVKCWGSNSKGQLGLGNTQSRGDGPNEMGESLPSVDLGPGVTAIAVSAGRDHTCVVLDDGAVKCWGANTRGQLGLPGKPALGDNLGEMGVDLPFVDLGADLDGAPLIAAAISAGAEYTCAVLVTGSVKCWGANASGQLGLGNNLQQNAPATAVDLGEDDAFNPYTAVAVSTSSGTASHHHTCALLSTGDLKCWGSNHRGQLGLGWPANVPQGSLVGDKANEMGNNLPTVSLGTGKKALGVTVGCVLSASKHYGHTCAFLDDGSAKCWGSNRFGVLGYGPTAATILGNAPNQMGNALPTVKLFSGEW